MFIILRNLNKIQFYLLHCFLINIKSFLILIRQSKPKSLVHVFPLRLKFPQKKKNKTFLWLTRTFDSTVARDKNKLYWYFIERQKDLNSISRTIKLKDFWYSVIENYRAFPIIYYNGHCNQRSLGIITCHKSTIFLLHIHRLFRNSILWYSGIYTKNSRNSERKLFNFHSYYIDCVNSALV